MAPVIRRKRRKGIFCDRYGAAFYDLRTENFEKVGSYSQKIHCEQTGWRQ
jgi:hypothetical protein